MPLDLNDEYGSDQERVDALDARIRAIMPILDDLSPPNCEYVLCRLFAKLFTREFPPTNFDNILRLSILCNSVGNHVIRAVKLEIRLRRES